MPTLAQALVRQVVQQVVVLHVQLIAELTVVGLVMVVVHRLVGLAVQIVLLLAEYPALSHVVLLVG